MLQIYPEILQNIIFFMFSIRTLVFGVNSAFNELNWSSTLTTNSSCYYSFNQTHSFVVFPEHGVVSELWFIGSGQGFQVLVETEWLDYGHKFADRCGHGENTDDLNERCPVFLQWLDCVHQLQRQFPCSFQFSEAFLVLRVLVLISACIIRPRGCIILNMHVF